ncbi:nascent polypeptide-associated complex subunit alpha [Metschnikowia bicuspidata var. bicuspidata NRRL YB-4993]|uniref:Nascent polypeptide-associated complex subunit alpha n=1 Tax=Metschnikowia bicuspidata var. bicuspidata NRRL YB-4993 TaxID=869754 RepID=A0A1A0HHX0_9ASCO|nr:nascent polypeptide-associated complex subunit alpha [Metschnikowia bicuspidata var. bicuspidata NRRL YB-4993]OBA23477.1 nascent polypeptide-associated complex subunit alpha [Metschnikowia bicuspidata var. bicuspidata NRRL YB-4993]
MSIEEIPQGAEVNIISKNEKKAREAIKKLNLKQVKGISRVTFKQRGNLIYAIDLPDVYKSPAGTYVVFGEAKVDDMNQRLAEAQAAQTAAAQAQAAGADADAPADKSPESITADLEKASLNAKVEEADEEDGDVDESGLDASDIAIIVEQTQVSRAKAVSALRRNKGDMVNAIMELS